MNAKASKHPDTPTNAERSGRLLAGVVCSLLAVTGAAVVAVGIGMIRQTHGIDRRQSLEYETLLAKIDEIMALGGDQAVLRFETYTLEVGRNTATMDSLVIEPTAARIPSLAPGGYLFEEVARYNAFQRERTQLATEDFNEFKRLEAYNPSLFRPYRAGDGSTGVTRTAAAWNRRVASPFGDRWAGEVRTADSDVAWSLYSPSALVPLDRPVRVSSRLNGRRRACDFEPRRGDAHAFCLSEARTPQLTLRGVGGEAAGFDDGYSAVAGWSALNLDGRRLEPGDSTLIEAGSILEIAPLDPVVFGTQRSGLLSSHQWVNGRMRRRGEARPPLDIFAALGRGPIDPEAPPSSRADVVLAVDEESTLELTEQLDAFVRVLPIPIEFATAVVARVSDGAVVAMAEVGSRSEPGRSRLLERVVPGSAVKPLLAAAVLSQRPELGSLTIPARSGVVRSVGGAPNIPSRQAFRTALNCAEGGTAIDLSRFLRCSNNEYAATLLLGGVTTPGASVDPVHRTGAETSSSPFVGRSVTRGTLLRSAFTEGMSHLFDVSTDPTITDTGRRSRTAWSGLQFTDGTPARVPFEALPDASRPALLSDSGAEATDLGLLYRYAFGAWENRWNVFDLTSAFGRVVSDRRMHVTLAGSPDVGPAESLELSAFDWYPQFLEGLAGVARNGTAQGLATRWREAGLPGTVFAKTGTLAEEEARRGSGLFIKSLLFAVGETGEGPTTPLECGVVGSVYLSFERGPERGPLPSYQVDFAERRLARFLAEHWEEFGACAETEVPVARTMGTG